MKNFYESLLFLHPSEELLSDYYSLPRYTYMYLIDEHEKDIKLAYIQNDTKNRNPSKTEIEKYSEITVEDILDSLVKKESNALDIMLLMFKDINDIYYQNYNDALSFGEIDYNLLNSQKLINNKFTKHALYANCETNKYVSRLNKIIESIGINKKQEENIESCYDNLVISNLALEQANNLCKDWNKYQPLEQKLILAKNIIFTNGKAINQGYHHNQLIQHIKSNIQKNYTQEKSL